MNISRSRNRGDNTGTIQVGSSWFIHHPALDASIISQVYDIFKILYSPIIADYQTRFLLITQPGLFPCFVNVPLFVMMTNLATCLLAYYCLLPTVNK